MLASAPNAQSLWVNGFMNSTAAAVTSTANTDMCSPPHTSLSTNIVRFVSMDLPRKRGVVVIEVAQCGVCETVQGRSVRLIGMVLY